MLCQVCGVTNSDEEEYCQQCQHKLLVVSGFGDDSETLVEQEDDGFSIEEHLLERISMLEEVLRRTQETVRTVLGALQKQEQSILVNHAGLQSLGDVLDETGLLANHTWSERWQNRVDSQLMALEVRDRFVAQKERIMALYGGDQRPLFERRVREAESALFDNDIQHGLRLLDQAFRLDRANYQLAQFLGESYFHEGELKLAERAFDRLLEIKPAHAEGLVYGGIIAHQRGAEDRAVTLLARAADAHPENFLPHFALAVVHQSAGRLDEAIELLEQAVRLDALPQAHYVLGECAYQKGRLAQAIRALSEAVRLDPTFEESYHLLGLCYLDRQWNRKALEAFRRAQRLNPRRLHYEDLVAYLSGEESPFPEIAPSARGWAQEAERAVQQGRPSLALRCYRRALREEADHPVLLMSYSLVCLQLDRSQEVRVATQRICEDERSSEMLRTTAFATLIAALRREGNYSEGNAFGRQLLEQGGSSFSRSVACFEMAYNLAEMEESLDEALELARNALSEAPEELRQFPLAALGWVHYKRQEYPQAIDCLSRSAELGRTESTMTHLGMALLAAGEDQRAREVLADARRLGPDRGIFGERVLELMKDSSRIARRGTRKR